MRDRKRILSNLESLYTSAFQSAEKADDEDRMSKLDFEFQRDQLFFELLLDVRDAFGGSAEPEGKETLLEKAEKLRRITKLR